MVAPGRASGIKMMGMTAMGAPISLDGWQSIWIVGVSDCVIFTLHQKMANCTSSPGLSRTKSENCKCVLYYCLGLQSIVMSMSVCESVCLSVCPLNNLKTVHPNLFCACCLWPWHSPLLTALQYVTYFRFADDVTFSYNGQWCIMHFLSGKRTRQA